MVWPFMGALGSARGISSEAISTDLAMATFGGIAAGFSAALLGLRCGRRLPLRSEEHTSELQSLMRISYAVFCLKKKTHTDIHATITDETFAQYLTNVYVFTHDGDISLASQIATIR